jgi:hypothetical protein
MLAADGAEPVLARTVDISASGMSVALPGPMKVGDTGMIKFDLFFEGKATPITARAKASYCIFSAGEFKVGLQFLNLDLSAMTVLAKYLR